MDKHTEILNYLLNQVKNGIEFAKDQVPQVVEEMLKYDAWEAGMWFTIPLYLIIMGGLVAIFSFYIGERLNREIPMAIGIIAMMMLCFGMVMMPIKGIQGYFTIKQIEKAPKYYLIEKLRDKK